MTETVLEATNISVAYAAKQRAVVRDASVALSTGERVVLLGPSGSGKTTLLRAFEGSVPIGGGSLVKHGRAALVYQDHRLVAQRSVLANVCMGAIGTLPSHQTWFDDALCKRARDVLVDLGLGKLADRRVATLSGGQKQRVAIARALCARPKILLADEPLASLDPVNAERVLKLLVDLQKKYAFALLLTTHDPTAVREFATRILRMEEGRLCPYRGEALPVAQDADIAAPPVASWPRYLGMFALTGALLVSALRLDLSLAGFANALAAAGPFLTKFLPAPAEISQLPWMALLGSLWQTIEMALWGTVLGIGVALPLAIAGARDVGPAFLRVPIRFLLNAIRTVPSIFWALIFVAMLGLGPIAGVFALAAYSTGYLTKFFYEAFEDAEGRPAAVLRTLGASGWQAFALATWPEALASMLGSSFFMFEYNIRAASILGVVGAGGIGQDLMYYFEWRQFPQAAAGLVLLLVVVLALDAVSDRVRRALALSRGR